MRIFIASKLIQLAVLVLVTQTSHAQELLRGDIDYPYLGIGLTIPSGWKGQEEGEYLILASDTEVGVIGLTANTAKNVAELKSVADQGWQDDGVSMQRSGDFIRIGSEGMGAEFSGIFQGAEAKAFIAGIINPFGSGVTIIALTSKDAYGPQQLELVNRIADGLKFSMPKEAEQNASWRDSLPGRVLTAMDSSSSSGTYYDDSGYSYSSYTSYSSRTTIHLCSNGEFYYSSSSSASFDSASGFGGVYDRGNDTGKWQLASGGNGESLLQLNYQNGTQAEWMLDYKDLKTYLDGERYFKTVSDACG